MKPQATPIHINAPIGKVADKVILSGDPLRAKYIAEKFLENAEQVTDVRNMLGYTGTYKGQRISAMASGMGIPSAGIYVFELLHFYNVQKIIRVGTCGAVSPKLKLFDIVLATSIYSETDFAYAYNGYTDKFVRPSDHLNHLILETAKDSNLELPAGTIISTPVFGPYSNPEKVYEKVPKDLEILIEEMEGFAVCHLANDFKREAAVLASVVDSPFTKEFISVGDRQTSLNKMIQLALDSIVK